MSRVLPPLNALRAFEAAGRHQSFSSAAQELGVAHSSISRHVRGLEQRLGVQLFREAARGVTLTSEGRAYLAQVSPMFDALSEATEAMTGRASGVVTISCEPTFATHFVMPRLGAFLDAFPEIEPRITPSQSLAALSAFEADVAIRSIVRTVPDQPSMVVSNAPLSVYGCPHAFAGLKEPAELLNRRRFQDRHGDPWRDWFVAAGVDVSDVASPQWRMRANLALPAALAGQGALLITDDIARLYVEQGALVRLFDLSIPGGTYQILVEPRAERRRAVRQFRDWLVAEGAPFRS